MRPSPRRCESGDVERAVALSGEHFARIEERLAQGIVERSEREIEDVLMPLAGEVGLSRARMRRPVKPIERADRSLPTPARRL